MSNEQPVDYYDRIADALQLLTGDNTHINDKDRNMDYYDRIADALEKLVENGVPGGGSSGDSSTPDEILELRMDENSFQLNHTWQEIYDSKFCILKITYNGNLNIYIPTTIGYDDSTYSVRFRNLETSASSSIIYLTNSVNGYPTYLQDG